MTEFWYVKKKSKSKFRLAIACPDDLSKVLGRKPEGGYYRATAPRDEAKRLLRWLKAEYPPVDVHKGELPPETNTVHQSDCLEYLRTLPDNCVDLICTDPPYGINFMQKNWDKALPPKEVWEECLRILRPGAFAFIMCTPRQDCLGRMLINLEDAGFVTSFTSMYWIYSSGFNKSANLGKLVDKRAGVEREVIGHKIGKGGENLNRLSRLGGHDSEDAKGVGAFGVGAKQVNVEIPITAPVTDEAKRVDGSYAGFQPKPAIEPIIVVMKPLDEKTYLDQALKNGKGCTWLDDCRIPIVSRADAEEVSQKNQHSNFGSGPRTHNVYGDITKADRDNYDSAKGRVPANVLVQGDALNDGTTHTSCRSKKKHKAYKGESNTKMLRGESSPENQYADSGSPSRYFSLDAWFAKRVKQLPKEVQRVFPNLMVPKAATKEKNAGLEGMPKKAKPLMGEFKDNPGRTTPKSSPTARENHHPTTKPVALMSYLITLGSREGDVVLDPYLGSGTTGVAAIALKRRFIGIEREEDYVAISLKRIKHAMKQRKKAMKRLFERK